MYRSSITIGKKDLKRPTDESLIKKITFAPEESWPSELKAKHFSATYALHRLCSNLSIHSLLAPVFKDYWDILQTRKKELPSNIIATDYISDPFNLPTRVLEKINPKENIELELADIVENSLPEFSMPPKLIQLVEEIAKDAMAKKQNENIRDGNKNQNQLDTNEKDKIVLKFVGLGFRKAHAIESLQYNFTEKDALHWLCIHVPEDDVPAKFIPQSSKQFIAQQHNNSLSEEYAIKRAISSGFSREIATSFLKKFSFEEPLAFAALYHRLISSPQHSIPSELDSAELLEIRTDEIEALRAIYDTRVLSDSLEMISVELLLTGMCVEFHIPKSGLYPFELPGIIVKGLLPTYIKLSVMKAVGEYALDSDTGILGLPMIFALVSWIDENIDNIIDNPPPLISFSSVIELEDEVNEPQISQKIQNSENKRKFVKETDEEKKLRSLQILEKFKQNTNTTEYQKMSSYRERLPSFKFRDQILNTLENSDVIVVCGETGCGKSTQIPQFILDSMILTERGSYCNIIITQPRRISATALAERISAERCEKLGDSTGYSIRGESIRGPNTRLLFSTTGVLLRMLQSRQGSEDESLFGQLEGVSHVIVDEVHERGIDSDFLLIALRRLIRAKTGLKVVLMSATINSDVFSQYFDGCPVLNIPGFTHPVKDIYLETIIRESIYQPTLRNVKTKNVDILMECVLKGQPIPKKESNSTAIDPALLVPWLTQLKKESGLDDIQSRNLLISDLAAGIIDYDLISSVTKHICLDGKKNEDQKKLGAILIFLPGVMEIQKCIDILKRNLTSEHGVVEIFPLHSNLNSRDQSKVFKKMTDGTRKIVVSTNIAETSITIDDVVFVIDTGRVKQLSFSDSLLSLVETFASAAACKQRRGRAGRVRPGTCYKLFSSATELFRMEPQSIPEMSRVPLEGLVLSIMAMGVSDIRQFLTEAIDPPTEANV
ncbi:hypothetical protein HK096_003114, partial [Nowakowskiella sp. JEL0078]